MRELYKRYLKACISLVVLVASLQACKKADISFGDEFLNNPNTQVVKIDTFTAATSTVFLDSFSTNGTGVAMAGGYTDPIFGKMKAQSYLQIAPPAFDNASQFTGALFDSITLQVRVRNFYGDSSQAFNIQVHELNEKITIPDGGIFIFNNKTLNVKLTALANENRLIRPISFPNLSIKLSNSLGQTLLNKLKNPADNDLKTEAAFLDYFKGIRISTDNNNSMAVSFSDTVKIRLFYKKPDVVLLDRFIDFNFINKGNQFNNVSITRVGPPFPTPTPTVKEFPSTATNNVSYVQTSTGVLTKISFPSINNILKLPNYAKLVRATLIVRPVTGTYNPSLFLPPTLRLATTTPLNDIGPDIVSFAPNGTAFVQLGELQTDYLLGRNTRYQYDVTEYIKLLITDQNFTRRSLFLIPPSPYYETSFARAVFGNKQHPENKMELQIFYIDVR